MSTKIAIEGPFRSQRKPRRRFFAQEAYYLLAVMGGVAYIIYAVLAG
jgi:hypothetical protein